MRTMLHGQEYLGNKAWGFSGHLRSYLVLSHCLSRKVRQTLWSSAQNGSITNTTPAKKFTVLTASMISSSRV